MELESNDKPHNSKIIGPAAPESLNDLTGKSSRYALILVGIIVSFGAVSVALTISTSNGLIGHFTRDAAALLVMCGLVVPLMFLNLKLPITRATRLCLYLFLGSALLHRILSFTDEVSSLDYVPILGNGSWLHSAG